MSSPSRCQLTTKNFSILEEMLQRDVHHDEAFLRLLRQKLSTATIVFYDDIQPELATINSRVEFTVDKDHRDNRILAYGGDGAFPGLTLSITTIRGLALLGMTAGETVVVQRSDDAGSEEIHLDKVSHLVADGKEPLNPQTPANAAPASRSSVIAFEARRKPLSAGSEGPPIDGDDDDPGPRAA